MKAFIDTSAFIALIFQNEKLHSHVVEKYQFYKKQKTIFITSDYILDELYTRCLYKGGEMGARQAIKHITEAQVLKQLAVLAVDSTIFKKAEQVFLKFLDQQVSFTDAVSYVLCKEFKIDEIFTLDADFKKMRLNTSFLIW